MSRGSVRERMGFPAPFCNWKVPLVAQAISMAREDTGRVVLVSAILLSVWAHGAAGRRLTARARRWTSVSGAGAAAPRRFAVLMARMRAMVLAQEAGSGALAMAVICSIARSQIVFAQVCETP